jgi:hypothetical protein
MSITRIFYLDTVNNDLDTIFVKNTNPNVNYTIHGLTDGITYDFNVYAMNSLGIGEGVDIQAIPSTTPDAPQFSYVGHGDGYVAMHWTAPNSNGSDIYEYRIFKSEDGGNIYGILLAILPATTFEYADLGLTNGITYHYKVSAVNANGESGTSNPIGEHASKIPSPPDNATLAFQYSTIRNYRLGSL